MIFMVVHVDKSEDFKKNIESYKDYFQLTSLGKDLKYELFYLNIKNVNKMYAVLEIMLKYQFKKSDLIAIGDSIKDASLCSQGETQTINTAISFSIIESGIDSGGYDVLRLDEVDGAFDEKRRIGFIDTIQNRIDEMGCDSCFIITHNGEFEDIPCDIIIFKQEKGMQIPEEKLKNKNVLFRYK
jgi:DNA repair exonuclease SbcCD ATPase subunit